MNRREFLAGVLGVMGRLILGRTFGVGRRPEKRPGGLGRGSVYMLDSFGISGEAVRARMVAEENVGMTATEKTLTTAC